MRMLLFVPGFIVSAFLTLSATSDAAPIRGGFFAHRGGMGFRTGVGGRNFASRSAFALNQHRRSFHRDHRAFFQAFAWPAYWYLDGYPTDYSYLDDSPDDNYQYWDSASATAQPEPSRAAAEHGPVVVIVKGGNSWPMDSSLNPASVNLGSNPNAETGQRRITMQASPEKIGPPADPESALPPAAPQPPQTAAKETKPKPQTRDGVFGNLVLISWLEEAGKDVIYVQNTETNDIQKITSEANLDNFRIVELHRNSDPKLFEAVISNGSQEGPVRFHF